MTWLLNLHPILSISKLSLFSFVFVVEPLLPCAWTQLESNQIIIFWLRLFLVHVDHFVPLLIRLSFGYGSNCGLLLPRSNMIFRSMLHSLWQKLVKFSLSRYVENLECNYASKYFSNGNKLSFAISKNFTDEVYLTESSIC